MLLGFKKLKYEINTQKKYFAQFQISYEKVFWLLKRKKLFLIFYLEKIRFPFDNIINRMRNFRFNAKES